MTTLNIKPFKNPQTGNMAEMVIDGDGMCINYLEICTTGKVEAGLDHEDLFWANWIPKGECYAAAHVIGEACLDDALSGLESELEAKSGACPWHSETTGL